ncbi:arogenate dehydrogenase 1, chloroplastic-like [Senna tora]|uniref:Arogenate dehydrogenase 1, chloroplastic-like n=1 Tax=Senna tora TaxID=362788 RepID=A0A834U253_9FABA|nr:arogenate dehydrogenase 1, chloroplastic-like [Senna tora]
MKIGIVGFGPFAQFLSNTIIKQGHTVSATSRSDYSHLCSQLGVQFFKYNHNYNYILYLYSFIPSPPKLLSSCSSYTCRDSCAFLDADNDVVLICTSILSLSQVLASLPLGRLKRPLLFVDVLSVKEHPKQVLLQVLPEESDILCTHPMFGPDSGKDGWRDLNFMYEKVRVRDEATCSNFLHIFASEGCRMLEMSCEEHDRLAAKSQFITHTIGRSLAEMDIKPTPIDTKSFQTLIQLKETTTGSSFDLFSGLFTHNRFAKQELENLENALHKVKEMLIQRMNEEQVLQKIE